MTTPVDRDVKPLVRLAFEDLNLDMVATLAGLTPARRLDMVSELAAAGRQALRARLQQAPTDASDGAIELLVSERMLARGGISPALVQRIRRRDRRSARSARD